MCVLPCGPSTRSLLSCQQLHGRAESPRVFWSPHCSYHFKGHLAGRQHLLRNSTLESLPSKKPNPNKTKQGLWESILSGLQPGVVCPCLDEPPVDSPSHVLGPRMFPAFPPRPQVAWQIQNKDNTLLQRPVGGFCHFKKAQFSRSLRVSRERPEEGQIR